MPSRMSAASVIAPNRSGASAPKPPGADPVVIQLASASPMAGDEENPEPLQPLATHRPGAPGTGPVTNRPSGLIVNIPPRCSAIPPVLASAVLASTVLASGTSPATW